MALSKCTKELPVPIVCKSDINEASTTVTPQRLTQNYIVCELPQKLNTLYSFIRNHTKYKTIVFFSSCKQVKFTYKAFCHLLNKVTSPPFKCILQL